MDLISKLRSPNDVDYKKKMEIYCASCVQCGKINYLAMFLLDPSTGIDALYLGPRNRILVNYLSDEFISFIKIFPFIILL